MIFCLPAGRQTVTETQRTPCSLTLVSAAELDQTEKVMRRAVTSAEQVPWLSAPRSLQVISLLSW